MIRIVFEIPDFGDSTDDDDDDDLGEIDDELFIALIELACFLL
jgi:hypothetical protein